MILESSIQDLVILAQWTPSLFWSFKQLSKRQAEDEETRRRLARNDPAECARMIVLVEELFQELLPRPGRPSRGLAQEPRWTGIIGVLEAAFEANRTTADGPADRLNAFDRKLVAARRSACRLAVAGTVSLPELRLLLSIVERQRQCLDIERRRLRLTSRTPQDLDWDRRSMSYLSSKMLAWTVPYALSLAREGRIQKEVLEIVLAGFRVALQDQKGHSRGKDPHRTRKTEAAIEELSRL